MKKYFVVVLVAMVSSVLTVIGWSNFSKSNNQVTSITSDSDSHFKTVSYEGYSNGSLPDFTVAAENTVNAVVHVHKFKEGSQRGLRRGGSSDLFDLFFGGGGDPFSAPKNNKDLGEAKEYLAGSGSGVIISEDGYIVTNNHVIEGSDKIKVTLNNQNEYDAVLVGRDPNTDIALLKIEESKLPHLVFSNSDQVKTGEWVLAVGNPFNLTSTVTAGIVSATGRNIDIIKQNRNATNVIESFIQTDAVVNPGNSGGALVNTRGELIGINTAISTHTGVYEGYSFAVPANLAHKVVQDLLEYGMVQRAFLGVNIIDLSDTKQTALYTKETGEDLPSRKDGIYVNGFNDNSGAKKAGIKKGDVIIKVGDKKIENFNSLSYVLGRKRPGEKVNITVDRDGTEKTFNVLLTNIKGTKELVNKSDLSTEDLLGIEVKKLDKKTMEEYGVQYGVEITKLDANGYFSKAGLFPGDQILTVNNFKVKKQQDIYDQVEKLEDGDVVFVKFVRNGRLNQTYFEYTRN